MIPLCDPEKFFDFGWRALLAVAGGGGVTPPGPLLDKHSRQKILAPQLQRQINQVEVDEAMRRGVWGEAVDFFAVFPKR